MTGRSVRIEFCGGIGAGKSTVALLLATRLGVPLVKEHYERIPFWEDFYRDPAGYELEKNISFLLFHGHAIRTTVSGQTSDILICDFALFQDLAYAAMSRLPDDYDAIAAIHDRLIARLAPPDLVVYARCSVDEQLARIRRRDREPERAITRCYLEDLSANIEIQLHRRLPDVPVIEVDTERFDFVGDPETGLAALTSEFERWFNRHLPDEPNPAC